jgi:hypothetical protein
VSAAEQTTSPRPEQAVSGEVVYGLVRAGLNVSGAPAGIAGAPVRVVESGGIAAIVSAVDALRASRRDLLAHSSVLEHALRQGPVLPLRFGMVVPDEEAVVTDLLERRREEIEQLLGRFAHVIELRVKAFYREDDLLRDLVADDPALARLRDAVRVTGQAAGHAERLRLGEAVWQAVEARRRMDGSTIATALAPLAEAQMLDDELPAGMTFAASYLVARDAVPDFDRAMDDLARRFEGRLTFKYLGPLPAHSFVSLEARWWG